MKRRSAAELEASKLRARRRRRQLLGWPAARLDDPPHTYTRHPGGGPRQAPPSAPIPALDPHPLVDDALAQLRPYERAEIGADMDAIGLDLVGTYCVAAIAGDDPVAAMVAERKRYRRDRAWLIFGTAMVDGLER